ncbi:MAG: hypothetical protein HRT35_34065 [Algicola sp.]|nr:hypothetical protein [Algicola sp.]
MIKKLLKPVGVLLLLLSNNGFAGELVKNAQIVEIGSSSDGVTDNFYIVTTGGEGLCVNKAIIFKRTATSSPEFFNRLYTTALTAYTTNAKKVRIYNTTDDSCGAATYIQINK